MLIHVSVDADGRPLCPHCGDPLVDGPEPGVLECPEAVSLRPALAKLADHLESKLRASGIL